ncbi:EpsG family protein [Capnocytophaga catalasegens]|uniref:EpsG family protein n=1 Tax=Capnocytophaga catalasegens TaxID=1004260 RepID=A0AAV5ASZ5_9FLAO|nr:EpsG family protein [Capnocytophaga catalasegens]GIZ15184.1 hypothetical protein RCZ03_11840 [Capnocytophaga catalasegens]GJM49699.1 hypothetical protein RCZ15_06740 [Capnocytophaga catalasegens]GJM52764.1 hypothetical protein RCZ16_10810 [Capnocytophaga catalasegens]
MYIYILLFCIVLLVALFRVKNLFLLTIFCVFLVFFVGLRHQIGGDWEAYLIMKEQIQSFNNFGIALLYTDPSYGMLNYIVAENETGIYVVNTVCALFLICGIYVVSIKQFDSFFSLLVAIPYIIFVVGMGYTRQSAALGLIFIAIELLINNKKKLSILAILLASTFHLTAIVMLVAVFFRQKINYRTILLITIVFFIGFIMLNQYVLSKMVIYGSEDVVSSSGGFFRHLLNIIPALLFFKYRIFFQEHAPNHYRVLKFLSIGSICLFLLGFVLSTLADRIALYFSVIQLMIYPIFMQKIVKKQRTLFILGIGVFYLIFMITWFNLSFYAKCCWMSYKNYLFL